MSITQPRAAIHAAQVSLRGVGKSFDGRPVLRDVSLEIAPGEIIALLGASGCGKSTLLRQISGLDTPSSGQITINGSAVAEVDQRCAVAFQEPRLLPWRTVAQNVRLGLPHGSNHEHGSQRVSELLQLVGLAEASDRRPRQVSGGMAQRASLARALAREPGVLVLDEPFGALDALTRLRMHDLLLDVHAAEPTTIVLVTHDVDEALYLADRIVLIGDASESTFHSGSTILSVLSVPGVRPRNRGDAELAHLRAELLSGLGVTTHHSSTESRTPA